MFVDGFKGVRREIKTGREPFEIFNIEADKQEAKNLAGTSPHFKALQKKMQQRVLQLRRPTSGAKRPYDDFEVPPILPLETTPGLSAQFMVGKFQWVPRVNKGESFHVTEPSFTAVTAGAVQFSGFLQIKEAGEYRFQVGAGSTVLHLHQALILDTDTSSSQLGRSKGAVNLAVGLHPFNMVCLLAAGGQVPQLQVSGSDGFVLSDAFVRSSESVESAR